MVASIARGAPRRSSSMTEPSDVSAHGEVMSATCAVCLQPIVTRHEVAVSGTEVMHRRCAAAGRETVGWKAKREIADLRAGLARAEERAKRELAHHQQAMLFADQRLDNAYNERDHAIAERDEAERARDSVMRDLNMLRADLAKRPPPQEAETAAQQPEYGKDAETRFSLLELDPL